MNETHSRGRARLNVSPRCIRSRPAAATKAPRENFPPLGVNPDPAPILISAMCLADKFCVVVLPHWLRAFTVVALLNSLMLTGIRFRLRPGLNYDVFLSR